jgi:type VI secretion system secreted protein Hcp
MASVDFFLKIDGVAGESTDEKHKGEIELDSWSFGAANASSFSSGGGAGVAKVAVTEFKFKKKVDKSSPNLFTYCCGGDHPKTATLICRKAGKDQQEYLKIEMSPVYIVGYDIDGSSGDEVPMEDVALAYGQIKFEYKPQKPDGTLDAPIAGGWDITKNKKP